jgi:aminoglycoside 3-N-acetyltransferase
MSRSDGKPDSPKATVPARFRASVGAPYRGARRLAERVRRAAGLATMSDAQLAAALAGIGIRRGATVMVHCSMDDVHRCVPTTNPIKLVRLLQELLGEEGTLLMPTFPFEGRQREYVQKCRTFDVDRTPSRTGLVTEVFRRMPGVIRSMHPTHSVAGWGRHAAELLLSHHEGTAFGENSPFHRLQRFDGLVVGIGVRLDRGFTILHVAEELHPRSREYAFETEPVEMAIVRKGESRAYELYPLRGDIGRDVAAIEKGLLRDGALRYTTRRGLKLSIARADRLVARCVELIEAGSYHRHRA